MPESPPGKLLTVLRFIIGGSAWLAPRMSGRLFGLDVDANPQAPYLGRLFGVRDAVLGVGLVSTSGDARRLWWRVGIACDVADLAAGLLAGRARELPRGATALVSVTAATAAALGTAALISDDT
jgi:hypothetical protein